jgi:diaminopimelate epimerase
MFDNYKELKMKFTKMQGLGNDYVYVNCFKEKVSGPARIARIISDRHTGIGADGLVLIGQSKIADVQMQIYNADGSKAEMCGNGIRCVAKYVYEHKLAKPKAKFVIPGQAPLPASLTIESGRGILNVGLSIDKNKKVSKVCVNMGEPILSPKEIGVNLDQEQIVDEPVTILGMELLMTCVSMGNPHAIFFCDDVNMIDLVKIGPLIENFELFGNRTNVHFVEVDSKNEFTMRTWERGSGLTMACGTGACASCVAGVLTNQINRKCKAHLPGGDLDLFWCEADNCVYMTGPAVEVFEGVFNPK